MGRLEHYYRVLGLDPRASEEALKRAYRDLVQVWHPDRFTANPRLQKIAQDRLREINEAFEAIRAAPAPTPTPSPSAPRPQPTPVAVPTPAGKPKRQMQNWMQVGANSIAAAAIVFAFIMAAAGFYRWLREPSGPPAIAASPNLPTLTPAVADPEETSPNRHAWARPPRPKADEPAITNGEELIAPRGRHGVGKLTVINQTELDAAASLVDADGETLRRVYVNAGEQIAIGDIGPGNYRLRVSSGVGWSWSAREFLKNRRAPRAIGPFSFMQIQSAGSVRGDQYNVVLQPKAGI